MKNKEFNWKDVKVFLGGMEITGIKSLEYPYKLKDLENLLKVAEENENYELCAEIKKQIDKLKNNKK